MKSIPQGKPSLRLDVLITDAENFETVAVVLKCPTGRRQGLAGEEQLMIKSHSAHSQQRYDAVKDTYRVEDSFKAAPDGEGQRSF
ncbi:hypothetical protein [Rhodoglobus aureus]|uniref:Uncharacterized protein n=1 Tax=Rhodoglobus aureus TaxID=191497 RepID=A0ABP4GGA3_9MICO